MAVPTINFGGFVYDDSGDAVSGATVNLFDKNDTTTSRASTTTNSSGYWAVAHTTSGEFDVQITSGSSKRRIKFDDAIQLTSIDTEVLKVRANEGAIAAIELYADEGEDASDRWRIDAGTDGVLAFGNDIASQGSYVDLLTVTPHATATSSTVTVAGILDVDGTTNLDAVDIDGAVDIAGDLTLSAGGDGALRFSVASSIKILDNNSASLVIEEADNAYMTFVTTNSGEKITVAKQMDFSNGFAVGSDANGDVLYSNGTKYVRLARGSDGDVLTLASSIPSWATPTTGDITAVTAGVGLSGGGSSGGVTLTLDLSELSDVTPANGDKLATLDSDGANEQLTTVASLATLFSGDGLTASSSVMALDLV